jgi:hypothetical protein
MLFLVDLAFKDRKIRRKSPHDDGCWMKNKQLNYPYCIASAASAHIVRPRIPPTSKARQ